MRWVVVGGAGFIGTHLCRTLEERGETVVVYDRKTGPAVEDVDALIYVCRGADVVVHLASNADIAAAVKDPTIDFYQGTCLTQNVLEAARLAEVQTVLYASGSGVYGDGTSEPSHEFAGFFPVSTYGASKLAGEAMLSAYCLMFGMSGRSYRFANVVGPNQTHGVGYDFLRKLYADPTRLDILGDGTQSKPYLSVDDAIAAMLIESTYPYDVFNVAPEDTMTVTEIADLACEVVGLTDVEYVYHPVDGGGGWLGDVPHVRLDCDYLRSRGWVPTMTSREAMRSALEAMASTIPRPRCR